MAPLFSRPVKPLIQIPTQREQEAILDTDNFDLGLITDQDPLRIPFNALTQATNLYYTRGRVFRRNGLRDYTLTKPDSGKVMNLFVYFSQTYGLNFLRFTPDKIYRAGPDAWTEFTPSGISANSGDGFDFFWFTVADDRGFFSNGIDPIREVLPGTQTYAALGNAPVYKYITSAFNRLIGFNLADPGLEVPYQVGWSGDLNYDEWDPLVDISSGFTPLVDTPADVSDAGTGIMSIGNTLVLFRQKSIWLGQNQASATNPFFFYPALSRVGADLPRAITQTDYGLVWYNLENSILYLWNPGEANPINLSEQVRRNLKASVTDQVSEPDNVWITYSQDSQTVSIFIASDVSSLVREWCFCFTSKNWTYNEYQNVVSSTDLDFTTSATSIDDLTGDIDSLLGAIDSLGGIVANATRFFGFMEGDIAYQRFYNGIASETEANFIQLDDDGVEFESVLATKIIKPPTDYIFSHFVRAVVTPFSVGTVTISYSKDDGVTWTAAKSRTFTSDDLTITQYIQFRKSVRSKRLLWKVTTSDCMCSMNGFTVKALEGGLAK